jgi:cation diffusion facilitator family transporter
MSESTSSTARLYEVRFVLWAVLALNLFVALSKLGYGLVSGSLGMQADGFHSLFDGVSNVIGLVGLWWASGPPDVRHPYGHKKFETLAAGGIGGMLLATCFYLVMETYETWGGSRQPTVTGISFVVMLVTMAINFSVMRWEQRKGRDLESEILIADSYHTASDLLTSVSVLAGLIAVWAGYPLIDSVVALVVAVVIAWTAMTVLREVLSSLTDQVRINPDEVRAAVMKISGILDCHKIRTRGLTTHVFVDLSIHVTPEMPVEEAHGIANQVEHLLKKRFRGVVDVVVHLEPEGHG